jgi:hypothetical protein
VARENTPQRITLFELHPGLVLAAEQEESHSSDECSQETDRGEPDPHELGPIQAVEVSVERVLVPDRRHVVSIGTKSPFLRLLRLRQRVVQDAARAGCRSLRRSPGSGRGRPLR